MAKKSAQQVNTPENNPATVPAVKVNINQNTVFTIGLVQAKLRAAHNVALHQALVTAIVENGGSLTFAQAGEIVKAVNPKLTAYLSYAVKNGWFIATTPQ
jgi:hypothetical protein